MASLDLGLGPSSSGVIYCHPQRKHDLNDGIATLMEGAGSVMYFFHAKSHDARIEYGSGVVINKVYIKRSLPTKGDRPWV